MKNNLCIKLSLTIVITILFITSSVTPLVIGVNSMVSEENEFIENPVSPTIVTVDGPMDSPWPMYCHDVRHTGRSSFSTNSNLGQEKWRFPTDFWVEGDPVIDKEGIIYFGSGLDFYAIYPDGTVKWNYKIRTVFDAAAIDENGVIYVGSALNAIDGNFLYALYPNGTLKWRYGVGSDDIYSSPAIGDDGTIYFGTSGGYPWHGHINALYPDGTLKWRFEAGHEVRSDPAIGLDGTVYCGSHDGNLYALYPNNGTLKWKYGTGDWVAKGPSIADDGTVYFGSWDGYLYACYHNGSLRWKKNISASTTPVIAEDGTIYIASRKLIAVYPDNGSVKWNFDPGPNRWITGGNPCISADGIIYFGTWLDGGNGGELIAVNPDGTERWRIYLGTNYIMSAPAIGSDGTIYVGSDNDGPPYGWGFLHAIKNNPFAPSTPEISGPVVGKPEVFLTFSFRSTSPVGKDLYYMIDWENGKTGWHGPYSSGETIWLNRSWHVESDKIIRAWARDSDNNYSPPGEFSITIKPRNRIFDGSLLLRFLELFPLLQKLLNFLTI